MDEHWTHKKNMSKSISLSSVDQMYDHVKKEFGVLGGKIIGAGGGGFLMLYCPNKGRELDAYMAKHEMPRVNIYPTQHGARVVTDMSPMDDFSG
jgi:D-glycero-alpha-D-manno-heptose-7-phosphate kinase